jgi:hypothetical protein
VLRHIGKEQREVATLVPGDFFGEAALLYGRRRSATIQAAANSELLRLSKEDFDNLVRRFPRLKPNLLISHESRELYRHSGFSWLGPTEVVYLIARRHKIVLYGSLVLPIAAGLAVAIGAVWLAVRYDQMVFAWLGALLELAVAAWIVWNMVDWSNDFYIVTNQRLVYLEKIVGIYDSRLEAPLGSIMSVNIQTDDAAQRLLNIGDVVVRTFSGPIVLKQVANPSTLAALIEEHWHRTRTREKEAEIEQIKRTIRERIGPTRAPRKPETPAPARPPGIQIGPPAVPGAGGPRPAAPASAGGAARRAAQPSGLGALLGRYFSFKLRFEQGGNVVYRKHWFILWQHVWRASLGLLGLVALLTLAAAGYLPFTPVLLVVVVLFIPLAGWWLYDYVDWRNDIYMVTAEQIFDLAKKPLGREVRKSAPLGNVLSLRYERPGLLGLLLNYGTVVAQVAGTEFRFEGVFDPVSVQNDVYRRIEAFNNRKGQAEAARRREEIADWLSVYHKVEEEMKAEEAKGDGAAG